MTLRDGLHDRIAEHDFEVFGELVSNFGVDVYEDDMPEDDMPTPESASESDELPNGSYERFFDETTGRWQTNQAATVVVPLFGDEPGPADDWQDRGGGQEPDGAQQKRSSLRFSDGGTFILDAPAHPTVVWGDDDSVLWVQGEPFLLVAPQGVGKTTLAAQLTFARVGLLPDVLGLPVVNTGGRVLYYACDRAAQIRRVFRRLADHLDIDRTTLEDRIVYWSGPPPHDFAKHPDTLTNMCLEVDADAAFIDSIKDVAIGLTDDEVGSGLNRALQTAIAEDIQVAGAHHQRKGREGKKPNTLEDVYGSTWITAGCGSIVLLWGAAGDPIVELTHLKQPAGEVGPWKVEHDHLTGLSIVYRGQVDPWVVLKQRAAHGLTANDLARLMYGREAPTDNERRKAQYQLDRLRNRGLAVRDEPKEGGTEGTTPARYYPADPTGRAPEMGV